DNDLDSFLTRFLRDFDPHLHQFDSYGRSGYPPSSLQNGVLPMFTDRWAVSGPNQHSQSIFPTIWPALQLASRLLMEDYPLLWFSRLTFGRRCRRSSPPATYLTTTEHIVTPAAIAAVKANLAELGDVITLMHAHRSNRATAYGIT
ncbi:hypothetical protein CC86DRAFT_279633, partial [Ophiobolus disseminans]